MSTLPLTTSRRLFSACTASLLVLPLLVGCGHRNRQCADSTPVNEKFWEISDQRRQLIAETRKVEPQASESNRTVVASADDKPANERPATTVDPFITAEEAANPVKQVAARESTASAADKQLLSDFDEFDREMDSLRRAASPAARESQPSLEWADGFDSSPKVAENSVGDEFDANVAKSGEVADPDRSQFAEEFDPREFDTDESTASSVAEELLDAPLAADEPVSHPLVDDSQVGHALGVSEIFEGPPVVQPKRPLPHGAVKAIDSTMIVDTIKIRPRGYRDTPTLEERVAMIESTLAPVAKPSTDDGLWSTEATVEAVEAPALETREIAMALPPAPPTMVAPSLTAPGVADTTPESTPESALEFPAPTTEPVPAPTIASEPPADTFSGSPLLVAPSYSQPDETVEEVASVSGPMFEAPLPALVGPAGSDEVAESTDVVDPFLTNGSATTVATLRSLDFDETEPPAKGAGNGSTAAWWFGGFAIGGVLLLLRARKRLMA